MRLLALTIFLSSFLVFQVQPLIGKYILPWFGGTPDVWTSCMLFFQMALLGGYAYAHAIVGHFGIRKQVIIHSIVLCVTLIWLPITPPDFLKPNEVAMPILQVLLVLLVSVGGPFVLVSSTAPLLQSWFSRAYPGHSPYRLYSLSNAGSLLGLFAYPFVIERTLQLQHQTWSWSAGYLLFVVLCSVTGWRVAREVGVWKGDREDSIPTKVAAEPEEVSKPVKKRRYIDVALWVMLSFFGSVMLLAVTNQLCQNVAAVPFLWVLPLGIYLVTFIFCFESDRWYHRNLFAPLWIIALGLGLWLGFGVSFSLWGQIAAYSYLLFVCCMVCHGELASLRPKPHRLTLFYFLVSIGGMLGGLFVALVAPMIFDLFYEFYVGLIGSGLAIVLVLRRNHWLTLKRKALRRSMALAGMAGLAVIALVIGMSWLVGQAGLGGGSGTIAIYRSFYGIVSVQREGTAKPGETILSMTHGNTTHGFQFESEDKKDIPTGYYKPDSGIGMAFRFHPNREKGEPLRVGILGLGAGAMSAYAKEGDHFQFYELDPNVEWFARQLFTYLYDAEQRGAEVEVILGDARVSLEKELSIGGSDQYDLLVLDAFSSDAVPVHLLTEEAFVMYRKHLKPDGILAAHISNRYLDLVPVVRSSVDAVDMEAIQIWDRSNPDPALPDKLKLHSHWILASNNREFLERKEVVKALTPWEDDTERIHWTDNFSSLFQVLRSE